MAELSTNDFRKSLKIEIDGTPFVIVECQHVKPGKGVAFVKTKYKNLITGGVFEKNFRSGDKVSKPDLESKEMTYLYREGDNFTFMDVKDYDQIAIEIENLGGAEDYLLENLEVAILFYQGRPISIELPNFVALEITECDPGIMGNTATNATKPATLETGFVVNVPLFVDQNTKVKVDTRTGQYVERAK